jgi:pimeloyl-ACP methyl ester carboxylesterase
MGLVVGLLVLMVIGASYQVIATEIDRRSFQPRGQMLAVNGHAMHLGCKGQGSPAVILQAGGAADSLGWQRIQNNLSAHTRVCAYDRPGHGWSEPTTDSRDADSIVAELRSLLQKAGVPPPYVMAGHSLGAQITQSRSARGWNLPKPPPALKTWATCH